MTDRGTINCGANSNANKKTMKVGDTVKFLNTTPDKKIDLTLPAIFDNQPANPLVVGKGGSEGPFTVKSGTTAKDYGYSWEDHKSPTAGTRVGTISVED